MDLKHIDYIVAVAEEKNISRAADKLNITQPALSQYLLNVEKNIGLPLFNRTKNLITLTYAGEIYLSAAKEILFIMKNAEHAMQDLTDYKKGTITIGIGQERGTLLLPILYPEFCKKYPGVSVEFIQESEKNLVNMTKQGYLDISLISTFHSELDLDYQVLCKEEIILVVHKSHRLSFLAQNSPECKMPVIDLQLFKDDQFALTKRGNINRVVVDSIFQDAGINPHVTFESESVFTTLNVAAQIQALTLMPESIISYDEINKNSVFFSINRKKYSKDIIVAYRKGTFLNRSLLDFIALLKSFFKSMSSFQT